MEEFDERVYNYMRYDGSSYEEAQKKAEAFYKERRMRKIFEKLENEFGDLEELREVLRIPNILSIHSVLGACDMNKCKKCDNTNCEGCKTFSV